MRVAAAPTRVEAVCVNQAENIHVHGFGHHGSLEVDREVCLVTSAPRSRSRAVVVVGGLDGPSANG
jgi:hypothetical protein